MSDEISSDSYGIINFENNNDNKISSNITTISEYFPTFINKSKEFRSLSNLNIVLDLDETLIHTYEEPMKKNLTIQQLNSLRNRFFEFKVVDPNTLNEDSTYIMRGVKRPGLSFFIIFCMCYFRNVIIWSAGQPRYVRKIVDIIFKDLYPPLIVYTSTETMFTDEGLTHKPLKKLFKDQRIIDRNINEKNTLVLDDKIETFLLNRDNGIVIPAYEPDPNYDSMMRDDICLFQLVVWLYKLLILKVHDVRYVNKNNIFTEDIDTSIFVKCKNIDGNFLCITNELFKMASKIGK